MHQLGRVRAARAGQHVLAMTVHRMDAEVKFSGNIAVRMTLRDEVQHLNLTLCERGGRFLQLIEERMPDV